MSSTGILTPRQARFIEEFLVDANGTQAAIRAGTAPAGAHVWACRTLKDPKVAAELKRRQEADSERLQVSRESVVIKLQAAYELAAEMQEPAAMVSAARELGRLFGFYAPIQARVDLSASEGRLLEQIGGLSDGELFRLIAEAEGQAAH